MSMSYRFWDIKRQGWRDLETGGRGRSGSRKCYENGAVR